MQTEATTRRPQPSFLRQTIRERVTDMFPREVNVILLYGSRARGDANDDSDWDVLVVLHDHVDPGPVRRRLLELTGDLVERHDELVQFVALRWKDANDAVGLVENAAREGVRL